MKVIYHSFFLQWTKELHLFIWHNIYPPVSASRLQAVLSAQCLIYEIKHAQYLKSVLKPFESLLWRYCDKNDADIYLNLHILFKEKEKAYFICSLIWCGRAQQKDYELYLKKCFGVSASCSLIMLLCWRCNLKVGIRCVFLINNFLSQTHNITKHTHWEKNQPVYLKVTLTSLGI